jgi:hypothetical protein
MRSVVVFFALCFAVLNPVVTASSPDDHCAYPSDLRARVSTKYQDTHLVTFADLSEYDRKLFRKDHKNQCPGLAKVDFYGDGKPTFAVVLISGENSKRRAELILAHQLADGWEIRSLDVTDGTPVVWRDNPAKYDDKFEPKTIRARNPVVVFCGLGSWAIIYAWTGKEVEKLQVSD